MHQNRGLGPLLGHGIFEVFSGLNGIFQNPYGASLGFDGFAKNGLVLSKNGQKVVIWDPFWDPSWPKSDIPF